MLKLYQVHVLLETTVTLEAESEEDAFLQASDAALQSGDWQYEATCIDYDTKDEEESCYDVEYFDDDDD